MSSSHKSDATGASSERRPKSLLAAWSAKLFPVTPDGSTALRDYRILSSLVGLAALVALLAIPRMPVFAAPLGMMVGAAYYLIFARRERLRQKLLAAPFPDEYREILRQRVPLYLQLSDDEKRRFEGEIAVFLGEQRIYALGGLEQDDSAAQVKLTDEHRVLIAASAAILLLGRPDWRLPARDRPAA